MKYKIHISIALLAGIIIAATINSGCGVYKFNDVAIPDTMKTFYVNFIENRAPYVNPQFSPALTDRLRRKISGQTKLSERKSADAADYEVKATITDYSVSTSAVANKQVVTNRLTVQVHVALTDRKKGDTNEYDVSWNTEFSGTLQSAEPRFFDEMVKSVSDVIFNRMFSGW